MKKLIALFLCLCLLPLSGCSALKNLLSGTDSVPVATPTAAPESTPAPIVDAQAILDRVNAAKATQTPQETTDAVPKEDVYGNSPSNLCAGGHVLELPDGGVLAATKEGIFLCEGGDAKRLNTDNAHNLNFWDGTIYYVADIYGEDEWGYMDKIGETLMRMNADGTGRTAVLSEAPVKYSNEGDWESSDRAVSHYVGYRDLMVYKGQLYFVSNNDRPGSMKVEMLGDAWLDTAPEATISWSSGISLFRCDLDGKNRTEIADMGQTNGHFTIKDDAVTYTYSVDNPYFSYPFVNFFSCALDGSAPMRLASEIYDNPDGFFASELGGFTEIVEGMFRAGDDLYVLCADSEGDFPNDRLMKLDEDEYEFIREEYFYVPTIADGQNRLIGFFCDNGVSCDADANGVYGTDYLKEPYIYRTEPDDDDMDNWLYVFGTVKRFEDEFMTFELSSFGENLYLLSQNGLYLVGNGTLTPVAPSFIDE